MIRALSMALFIACAATPALAHKVIASVFPSGDVIEGELGFSSGDMAQNALVEVFDASGTKLGETMTDEDGFFTFAPTQPVAHVFRANLGSGHVGKAEMPAEDVARILGLAVEVQAVTTLVTASSSQSGTIASLTEEEKQAIAKIVRDETRPLRQEITAYKERNNLQTILGGLGYIIGLFGVGFYITAQRKLKEAE